MTPPPEESTLRQELIGSLSRSNMQEAGSRVSEILIEKEADKILKLIQERERLARIDEIMTYFYEASKPESRAKVWHNQYFRDRLKELKGKL